MWSSTEEISRHSKTKEIQRENYPYRVSKQQFRERKNSSSIETKIQNSFAYIQRKKHNQTTEMKSTFCSGGTYLNNAISAAEAIAGD